MLIIPQGTPRRSKRDRSTGELSSEDTLKPVELPEPFIIPNETVHQYLQIEQDRSLLRALKGYGSPAKESATQKKLREFLEVRNSVPSKRTLGE